MTHRKKIWLSLFALYCIAMGYLLFGREEAPAGIPYTEQLIMRLNPVPFRTLLLQIKLLFEFDRPWLIRHSVINLGGNVALFVPLGIFLPKVFTRLRTFGRVLAATAGIMTAVELTQMFTLLGRCDIDDLILNLTGAAIGYGLYKWIWNKRLPH